MRPPVIGTPNHQRHGPSRRQLLKWGCASLLAAADAAIVHPSRTAYASSLEVPMVEGLCLTVVMDGAVSCASMIRRRPELMIEDLGGRISGRGPKSALLTDRAFSLHVRSLRRTEMRNTLFDFGCAQDALSSNMERLRIDPAELDRTLSTSREPDRRHLPPVHAPSAATASIGVHGISAATPVLMATATTEAACAAATPSDGPGGTISHLSSCLDDRSGITASFLLICRGLIIVTSCEPRSLVAAAREAQSASGIEKIHAIVVGANTSDAAGADEINQAVLGLKALEPDHLLLGHCSGERFRDAAKNAMPGQVIRTAAGMRISFVL